MGQVKIVYSYKLLEFAGLSEEWIEVPTPIPLGNLLAALGLRHGEKFVQEMNVTTLELGEKSDFYLIFVNGERVGGEEKKTFTVNDNAEISFLPLIGGG